MKSRIILAVCCGGIVISPAVARAEEEAPAEGLWSKFSLGVSSAAYAFQIPNFDGTGDAIEASLSGGATEFRAAAGLITDPGLVLHASLGMNRLAEPDIKVTFQGDENTETSSSTFSMFSACAGATRYFGSASITGRGGYALATNDDDDDDASGWISGVGVDYDFSTGARRRFGVGLNFDYAEVEFDSGDTFSFASLGLLVSASFY